MISVTQLIHRRALMYRASASSLEVGRLKCRVEVRSSLLCAKFFTKLF